MAEKHSSIKRIIRRCMEEISATIQIAKVTSLPKAWTTFHAKLDIQAMNRNGFDEKPAYRKRLIKKHEIMMEYFEKTFSDFCANYDYDRELPDDDERLRNRIWICWWQGLENAPEIVKKCVRSVQENAGEHTVTIITEENYKEYVHIPEWVGAKRKKGVITLTNYSDLLRLSLLAEHGGMWLDATFFCCQPKLSEYFSYPLWSIKRPDYLHCSIASGYFAGYSLQCQYQMRWIFVTIRDFFLHYWETNDKMIDYLLVDYMIVLAQRKDERIAQAFREILANNPACDELYKVLGQEYDEKTWSELSKDTALFKLTWKQEFPLNKDGKETFYAKLLDGVLGG